MASAWNSGVPEEINLAPRAYLYGEVAVGSEPNTLSSATAIRKRASTNNLMSEAVSQSKEISGNVMRCLSEGNVMRRLSTELSVSRSSSNATWLGWGVVVEGTIASTGSYNQDEGMRRVIPLSELEGKADCPDLTRKFKELKASINELNIYTNYGVKELMVQHGSDAHDTDTDCTESTVSNDGVIHIEMQEQGRNGRPKFLKAASEPRNVCKVGEFKKAVRRLSDYSPNTIPEQEMPGTQKGPVNAPRRSSLAMLANSLGRQFDPSPKLKDQHQNRRGSIAAVFQTARLEDEQL